MKCKILFKRKYRINGQVKIYITIFSFIASQDCEYVSIISAINEKESKGIEVPVRLHRHGFWTSDIRIYWNIRMSGIFGGGFVQFLRFKRRVYINTCHVSLKVHYKLLFHYKHIYFDIFNNVVIHRS